MQIADMCLHAALAFESLCIIWTIESLCMADCTLSLHSLPQGQGPQGQPSSALYLIEVMLLLYAFTWSKIAAAYAQSSCTELICED